MQTLQPRIKPINTNRITRTLTGANVRIAGRARMRAKLDIYTRDGGACQLCYRTTEIQHTQLDHRVALQFGGTNDTNNLWTLCRSCHDIKSAHEARYSEPFGPALDAPQPIPLEEWKARRAGPGIA